MEGIPERVQNGFGRDARLNRQSEFQLVRTTGHSIAGRYCVINLLESPPDGQRRAAFSISRRYSKLAVVRNRARRLFREVYRELYTALPPSWLIFVPRHRMDDAKMAEVLADVQCSLRRLAAEKGGAQA